MTWTARRRAWEAKRLGPALERAPERRIRFSTISDTEVDRLYGPWSWGADAGRDGVRGDGPSGGGGSRSTSPGSTGTPEAFTPASGEQPGKDRRSMVGAGRGVRFLRGSPRGRRLPE